MKRAMILAVLMCVVAILMGCGGKVDNDYYITNINPAPTADAAPVPTDAGSEAKSDAGKDALVEAESDADSGSDADAAPLPDADAEADAQEDTAEAGQDADAATTKKLYVSFQGPPTGDIWGGVEEQILLKFNLTAGLIEDLEIQKSDFTIECYDGMVKGSQGSAYFTTFEAKSVQQTAYLGPMQLPDSVPNGANSAAFGIIDSFVLKKGKSLDLAVMAFVSGQENASGELFGKACRLVLKSYAGDKVKGLTYGQYLTADEIETSDNIVGNWLTVKQPPLAIDFSPVPTSSVHMKKEQNVPTVGITLRAGAKTVSITQLAVTGQVNPNTANCQGFGGQACNVTALINRVNACALFDGSSPISLWRYPEADGKFRYSNLNLTVPQNNPKKLVVKCNYSSADAASVDGDKLSVGIADASDVVAMDTDSINVVPMLSPIIKYQATGTQPTIIQTILTSGTLTITADAHPASDIVVGGDNQWKPAARYKFAAQYEEAVVDFAMADNSKDGDGADFQAIAVATGGQYVSGSESDLPAGAPAYGYLDLSISPIKVPKDGYVYVELWAKYMKPEPSSVTGDHQPRSGHAPRLGISSNVTTTTVFGTEFAGKMNVQATGTVSGERIYAPAGAEHGNRMVLRACKPLFAPLALITNVLMQGAEQEHYRWLLSAQGTNACSFAWKQIMFHVEASSAESFSNYRLYRGGSQVPMAEYNIMDAASGQDIRTSSWSPTYSTLVISFKDHELTTQSGNVYSLRATGSGPSSGQSVSIEPDMAPDGELSIGTIQDNTWAGFDHLPDLYVVNYTYKAIGYFIWNDLTDNASWMTGWLVKDMTKKQTLSN